MISTKGKISHSNYPLKCLDLLDKVHDKSASAKRNAVILYSYPSIKLKKKGQLSLGADVDCLICQVYMKLAKVPHIVVHDSQPAQSPNGQLPFAVFSSKFPKDSLELVCGTDDIITKCEEMGYELDSGFKSRLSEAQLAEFHGLKLVFSESFKPALFFNLFCEPENTDLSTPLFADLSFDWAVRSLISSDYRRQAIKYIEHTFDKKVNPSISIWRPAIDADEVYDKFRESLSILSRKLGSSGYLMGSRDPSSLDVFLFAYIDIIMAFAEIFSVDSNTTLRDIVFRNESIIVWYNKLKKMVI